MILKHLNLFLINNNFRMKFFLKTKKGINYYLKIYYKSKLLEKIPFDQTNLLNYLSQVKIINIRLVLIFKNLKLKFYGIIKTYKRNIFFKDLINKNILQIKK